MNENPFKKNEQNYPMDFGFPFSTNYLVSIDLGNIYTIDKIAESRRLTLQGDDGECSVSYIVQDNTINIHFNIKLTAYRF